MEEIDKEWNIKNGQREKKTKRDVSNIGVKSVREFSFYRNCLQPKLFFLSEEHCEIKYKQMHKHLKANLSLTWQEFIEFTWSFWIWTENDLDIIEYSGVRGLTIWINVNIFGSAYFWYVIKSWTFSVVNHWVLHGRCDILRNCLTLSFVINLLFWKNSAVNEN